ncbi:nucleotidyltransferase domain-containing protein [Planctomycetota bacterium]
MSTIHTNMFDYSRIKDKLKQDPRILAAYLLGSVANGNMRPDSDIDIAILPQAETTLSHLEIFELAADLTEIAARNVDLGLLSSQNLVYASEALLKGQRICCQDIPQTDLMVATLLGLSLEFNIERKEIIDVYTA